ncbi:hypothetical protein IFM89_019280 [Coptis chinensis]|uniref:eRF1/Pelota-like N-terminal domain-containing protein n=1 Tax=Coptis chinensis TaxID=261450 RepID=A0A835LMR7_9MAGN|nr:hypothetical protein IFM89_019280 [Coptis chinensis]
MKLSIKDEFTVNFFAEEEDDLWSVYNLICQGDRVEAETSRKMDSNGIKKTSATRVKVKVEIKVAKTKYDKVGSVLNISGNIVSSDTASVRIGGSHTLKIKQQLSFELTKNVQGEKPWGKKKSTKNSPSIATANSFFKTVLKAFIEHVDLSSLTSVVLASPGTLKDEFHRYLIPEARSLQLKPIVNKKVRFVLISSTSQSLKEVLDSPAVKKVRAIIASKEDGKEAATAKKQRLAEMKPLLNMPTNKALMCMEPSPLAKAFPSGMQVLEKLLPTPELRQDITGQMFVFKKAQGMFGCNLAREARNTISPDWVEGTENPLPTQWLDRFGSALDGGDLNTRQFTNAMFGASDHIFGL